MAAAPVVERLDEIEDRLSCLCPGCEATRVDALGLEGGEEALGDRVDAPMFVKAIRSFRAPGLDCEGF